jgi:hypothetical protein
MKLNKVKVLKICYLDNKKFLIFNVNGLNYYKILPRFITIGKEKKDEILFNKSIKTKRVLRRVNFFLKKFSRFNTFAKRVLILQGLGLKVNLTRRFLEFKLGYSHLCKIKKNKEINLNIKKNILYFKSLNKEKLGNYTFKIKNLRFPDSYKGKGIWYKNERKKLKAVKKK